MENTQRAKTWSILNLIGLGAVITVNALANALPINGMNTGEISDLYPNLFVPAGITFSIWGIIYFLLACFTIYSMVGAFRHNRITIEKVSQIGPWFFISCIANASWIFAWHYRIVPLSLAIMLVLLFSLIYIYLKLRQAPLLITARERFFLRVPFGVYLGWITIATIANVTAFLVSVRWNRFGLSEDAWLTIMIGIAILLTVFVIYTRKDAEYTAVVIWALIGIIIKRNELHQTQLIGFYTAIAGIVLLAISLFLFLRPKHKIGDV